LLGKFFSSDDIFLSCEQGVPKRAESDWGTKWQQQEDMGCTAEW
jgi:hypothetical protein